MAKHQISERPSKRAKLLSDESGSDDSEGEASSVDVLPSNGQEASNGFTINQEFARRFEHNKKREELHRLEEKYKDSGDGRRKRLANDDDDDDDGSDEDESTSEEEDDDAELATAELDQEIFATLKAIKEKDPRVYDKDIKFYKEFDPEAAEGAAAKSRDKPMYLHDYHRKNLMEGFAGEDAEENPIISYQDEQDALKRQLVGSMHASKPEDGSSDEDGEDFMVAKAKPRHTDLPAQKVTSITDADIKDAEKDPETYLSNFMAARAWLPNEGVQWQPFESDDSDDEARADDFEEAYNMRFEDPKMANEKLQSFARDVGKYGVRREEKSRRKLARAQEREAKDLEKIERDEERTRLRKLRIEEAEEKVRRIKNVAGIRGKDVNLDDWRDIIEGDFDDAKWEREMMRRFDDAYYAQSDAEEDLSGDEGEASTERKTKAKKPKWDDDIDIKDLVPDFDDKDPEVHLTSDEEDGGVPLSADANDEDGEAVRQKRKTKKDRAKEKVDAKRAARKERVKLEEIIDASIPLSHPELAPSASSSKAPAINFRYRETSPTTFGLSARDILFAEDSQLNQYAGLKKFAAFRDEEKKRKDKKRFSKKARLRQWRKETFGNPDEPAGGFERLLGREANGDANTANASKTRVKERSKRTRKGKKKDSKETEA